MKTIGFIGLGVMGKPMAKNLLKAGYTLKVYDIRPEPVKEVVAAGAQEGRSSKDAAEFGEVIITMLPNSPDVKEAVLSKDGVLDGAVWVRQGSFDDSKVQFLDLAFFEQA